MIFGLHEDVEHLGEHWNGLVRRVQGPDVPMFSPDADDHSLQNSNPRLAVDPSSAIGSPGQIWVVKHDEFPIRSDVDI